MDYMVKERNYCAGTSSRIVYILRLLNDLYGKTPVSQFNPAALKSVRRRFLESGLARDTINNYMGTIKQVFCWGCEEEIVPAEIAGAL